MFFQDSFDFYEFFHEFSVVFIHDFIHCTFGFTLVMKLLFSGLLRYSILFYLFTYSLCRNYNKSLVKDDKLTLELCQSKFISTRKTIDLFLFYFLLKCYGVINLLHIWVIHHYKPAKPATNM